MTGSTIDATPTRHRRPATPPGLVIGVLVVSAFVMILNETIMSVSLQHLTADLDVTATTVQWLTSGFLLTMGVVIPTTGFLLQRFTSRQVFLAAMGLFIAGTLICALAPGFGVLLVGRVVQASGTAVMLPLLMTTVMTLIPADRRGATMGTVSIVIAVAPAIGPTIGGVVLAALTWRWLFWCVLPLAVAAFVLGAAYLRVDAETRPTPLDVPSVLISAVGLGGIVYSFSTVGEAVRGGGGAPLWVPLAALAVGAAAMTWFVARQLHLQRTNRALLDLRPFGERTFATSAVLSGLMFMCLLGAGAVLLPLYLQDVLRADAFTTGLALLPGGLVLGLLGRPVGRLFDRFGARPLVIPGSIALAASLWLLALLGPGVAVGEVIATHILLMVGLGLMMIPLLTAALSVLPPAQYSHGSAIMTTLQQVAGAAGTAAFVTIAVGFSTEPTGLPDATGLRAAFMVAGTIGVLAIVGALLPRGRDDHPAGPAAATTHVPEGPVEMAREAAPMATGAVEVTET
jgi:drug resistance transporter, EmrB/QacA subfamily